MKRYLASFVAPIAIWYVFLAFANWTLRINPADWEDVSRAMFAMIYVFVAGLIFTWPGWKP